MEENCNTKVSNYDQIINITFFGFGSVFPGFRINFAGKKKDKIRTP